VAVVQRIVSCVRWHIVQVQVPVEPPISEIDKMLAPTWWLSNSVYSGEENRYNSQDRKEQREGFSLLALPGRLVLPKAATTPGQRSYP
jgi:hypothetical protein